LETQHTYMSYVRDGVWNTGRDSKENVREHLYWGQICRREEGAVANILSNHLEEDIAYLAGGLSSAAGEVQHAAFTRAAVQRLQRSARGDESARLHYRSSAASTARGQIETPRTATLAGMGHQAARRLSPFGDTTPRYTPRLTTTSGDFGAWSTNESPQLPTPRPTKMASYRCPFC